MFFASNERMFLFKIGVHLVSKIKHYPIQTARGLEQALDVNNAAMLHVPMLHVECACTHCVISRWLQRNVKRVDNDGV